MQFEKKSKDASCEIAALEQGILQIWDKRDKLDEQNRDLIDELSAYSRQMIHFLNIGQIRASEKRDEKWILNEWVKKGILLIFRLRRSEKIDGGIICYKDKLTSLGSEFLSPNVRLVPTSYVREGVFLDCGVVVMPAFVNIGAHIGKLSMIDSYATIGSCAQIGEKCHISSSAVIAGVLEPLREMPVIIEDRCFVGAGCVVAEGVIVREGSVLGAGVVVTASTKILDIKTGIITQGEIPPYSVLVPGFTQNSGSNAFLQSAVIIKTVDAETLSKVPLNELLR